MIKSQEKHQNLRRNKDLKDSFHEVLPYVKFSLKIVWEEAFHRNFIWFYRIYSFDSKGYIGKFSIEIKSFKFFMNFLWPKYFKRREYHTFFLCQFSALEHHQQSIYSIPNPNFLGFWLKKNWSNRFPKELWTFWRSHLQFSRYVYLRVRERLPIPSFPRVSALLPRFSSPSRVGAISFCARERKKN